MRSVRQQAGTRVPSLHQTSGFALAELLVVMVILAILIALLMPRFLSVRASARNDSMQAVAAKVANKLVQYNEDYPVIPPRDTWPPPANDCNVNDGNSCWDPLLARSDNTGGRYPDRSTASAAGPTWTSKTHKQLTDGLVDREGRPYIRSWPESPYGGTTEIQIFRGTVGTPRPGTILVRRITEAGGGAPFGRVLRFGNPLGAFQVVAWGRTRKGATAVVYAQTFGARAPDNTSTSNNPDGDCGYSGRPQCPAEQ